MKLCLGIRSWIVSAYLCLWSFRMKVGMGVICLVSAAGSPRTQRWVLQYRMLQGNSLDPRTLLLSAV